MEHLRPLTRRGLMGASVLGALSLTGAKRLPVSRDVARGRVVEIKRGREFGIPGVLVSNGVEVTPTDDEGAYTLPFRDGVFVIKPANFDLPLDISTGAPSFYYSHRAFGSGKKFARDQLDSMNFILERRTEPKVFSAILMADPQPANNLELNFLRRAMDKMSARAGFAFGMVLGDIASDNLSIYDEYRRLTGRLGAPVWHIPGNHDHDTNTLDARMRLETWRTKFGPATYAFEHSGALFFMLDNVKSHPGGYTGAIGPAGLSFVRNVLAFMPPEKLIVVCTHIPLLSSLPNDPSCNTSDVKALMHLLAGRRSVSFSGHMHTSEHHYLEAPGQLHHHQIIAALSGSWWSGPFDAHGHPLSVCSDGAPHGWHELSIDGAEHHTAFVSGLHNAVARAILPDISDELASGTLFETVAAYTGHNDLLVNVFDGGPRTQVWIEVAGQRHMLNRVQATDPYVVELYRQAGKSLKFWVKPQASSHLWALTGFDLPAGALATANLTIIDEFGRTKVNGTRLLTTGA